MHCTLCNYNWCWVCGHSLDHWTHRLPINPFSCSRAPRNPAALLWCIIQFIFGLLFLPAIIFSLTLAFYIYQGIKYFQNVIATHFKKKFYYKNKNLAKLIFTPFFLIYIAIVIGLAAVLTALTTVIIVLPSYVIHIYTFGRTLYWWRKSRVKKMLRKTSL